MESNIPQRDAIAISVYDKFEEVRILVDIIRKNWKRDYIITVCCNHPNGEKELSSLDIDTYVQGDDVPYSSNKPLANLTYRVVDTIRKSCLAALEQNPRTIMHVHSDAWPLDEECYLKIIDTMYENKAVAAGRGFGFGYSRLDCPLGHLDDMFFIVDAEAARSTDLFNIRPLTFSPHWQTIHGIMSAIVMVKIGIDRFYLYDDHSQLTLWPNKPKLMPYERAKPVIFDERNKLLHVHTASFPGDYGKHIQAIYLQSHNITQGEHIKRFIDRWNRDAFEVYSHLDSLEVELNKKLKMLAIDPNPFGQEFTSKLRFLENVTPRIIFNNALKRIISSTIRLAYSIIGKQPWWLDGTGKGNYWPTNTKDYYSKALNQADYSKATDDFWFDSSTIYR